MLRLDDPFFTILLDWIGSVLMLGSLWGWIYNRIQPLIDARVKASSRRRDALARLGRLKYGLNFEKIESVRKTSSRQREIGIFEGTSATDAILWKLKQARMRRRLQEYGLASNEEEIQWLRESRESAEAGRIVFAHWLLTYKLRCQRKLDRWVARTTRAIFVGRVAVVLFVIGFALWNLSKALSLLVAFGGPD